MKTLINKAKYFFFVQGIALLACGFFLINFSKKEAQLIANTHFSTFFDYLFYSLTHAVEFWGCLIIYVLIAVFKSYKYAIIGLLTYATSGLIAQLLKRNVFADFKRPTVNIENLRLIPDFFDYQQNTSFSFPSGHATAAFTLFLFLTLVFKNKKWGVFFSIAACLVAYSRVYLSQHYFIDIFAGAILGSVTTLISFYFFDKINFGTWANNSLF